MSKNTINLIGIVSFFILGLVSFVYGQTVTEQLTLSTYYPSPVGDYAELTVQGGAVTWTTTGWRKALIIGSTGGEAIQFTNSGAGVRHFGLGANNANQFYSWYTSTNTGVGDSAHNWLHVDASVTPPIIYLIGQPYISIASEVTVDPLNGVGGYLVAPRYRDKNDTP